MLSVPWLIGWALRPYLPLSGTSRAASTSPPAAYDSGSLAARAQVNRLSSPSAAKPAPPVTAPKPVTPLPSPTGSSPLPSPTYPLSASPGTTKYAYPVTTKPTTTKDGGKQVQPQPVQQVTLSKNTASKTSSVAPGPTPLVAKQAQPLQLSSPLVAKQAHPVQLSPPPKAKGQETLVSSKTITLNTATMSEDWAQQQLEKFKVSFEEADRDKSGFLSFDEVFNIISKNGFKGTKDEAKKLFAQLDVDNDQKLSHDEFTSAMKKLPRMTVKEYVLRKAFKQLDKDDSGTLSRQEIESAAKQEAGLDISAGKIADLLVMLSKDTKDNVVDYEEFLSAWGIDQTATVMHHIFKKLDWDNSGFLTKDEIMKAVEQEHELKLRAAKISDLILAWHKDADKKISYDEFLKVWTTYK
ncbi:uncharacterized protein [Littorina saxatilis]|uniref:EF-hand domain-containing protein n=1 Tax=Littorina saxatilis TaxID=31220 RepID=A0AAN9C227_9CAEN